MGILPLELLRVVIRLSTAVPVAFDTSFKGLLDEDPSSVLSEIAESMSTKIALCLVSKDFFSITEEHRVYEIVTIYHHKYIRKILRLLKSSSVGETPCGHHVRRLHILLGQGKNFYRDEGWANGACNLWGLFNACPRVQIFLCCISRSSHFPSVMTDFDSPDCMPHNVTDTFWQTLASTCASSLTRLEFYDIYLPTNIIEIFFRYCHNLQACQLVNVVHKNLAGYAGSTEPSGWPPVSGHGSLPYHLPSLHTLHVDPFDPHIFTQFRFQNLVHLGAYGHFYDTIQTRT